ncbi:MAG TPA: ChrR family anti-sigma-E factor [Dongiaceae bacterium]|nr:ChrR family anti-sigma-E factor [Dongiaceae bacterium]
MKPQHHPPEEFLLQYASGAATEPFALVIAAHLVYCAQCRAAVAQAEAIGGALLDALEPASADQSSVDRDIAKILDRAARQPEPLPRAVPANLASPLGAYVGDLNHVSWRPLGPGIQHSVLAKDKHGAVARLLRIAPGRSVFGHSHGGNELTLVLEGSYRAGGAQFRSGDVECADETVSHRPVADPGATCICLAVTDRPLRFHNLLGRLMQNFIRI